MFASLVLWADLVDLRGQEVAKNLTFNMGSANFPEISNHTFVANDVQFEMPVGEAVGLDLNGVSSHPFHIHVNPFQLTQNPLPDNDNNWFRSGDWRICAQRRARVRSFGIARVMRRDVRPNCSTVAPCTG